METAPVFGHGIPVKVGPVLRVAVRGGQQSDLVWAPSLVEGIYAVVSEAEGTV